MTAPLLTEPQAAAHLAVCQRTLRKARKAGRLRYVLIGRAIRYTLADLEQFVDSQRQQEGAPCPVPQPRPAARARTTRAAASAVIVPFTQRPRAPGAA